jgi:hypothetical protein
MLGKADGYHYDIGRYLYPLLWFLLGENWEAIGNRLTGTSPDGTYRESYEIAACGDNFR